MGPIIADLSDAPFAHAVAANAAQRARRDGARVVVCVAAGRSPRRRTLERALGDIGYVPPVEVLDDHPVRSRAALVQRTGASLLVMAPTVTALLVMRAVSVPIFMARRAGGNGPVIGATDYADPGFPALTAAVNEATALGRPLILCHVIDEHTRVRLSALGLADAEADVERQLVEFARTSGATANAVVRSGDPTIELVQLSQELRPSLLVLARRIRRRQPVRFIPAAGDLVIAAVGCNVLLVPKSS